MKQSTNGSDQNKYNGNGKYNGNDREQGNKGGRPCTITYNIRGHDLSARQWAEKLCPDDLVGAARIRKVNRILEAIKLRRKEQLAAIRMGVTPLSDEQVIFGKRAALTPELPREMALTVLTREWVGEALKSVLPAIIEQVARNLANYVRQTNLTPESIYEKVATPGIVPVDLPIPMPPPPPLTLEVEPPKAFWEADWGSLWLKKAWPEDLTPADPLHPAFSHPYPVISEGEQTAWNNTPHIKPWNGQVSHPLFGGETTIVERNLKSYQEFLLLHYHFDKALTQFPPLFKEFLRWCCFDLATAMLFNIKTHRDLNRLHAAYLIGDMINRKHTTLKNDQEMQKSVHDFYLSTGITPFMCTHLAADGLIPTRWSDYQGHRSRTRAAEWVSAAPELWGNPVKANEDLQNKSIYVHLDKDRDEYIGFIRQPIALKPIDWRHGGDEEAHDFLEVVISATISYGRNTWWWPERYQDYAKSIPRRDLLPVEIYREPSKPRDYSVMEGVPAMDGGTHTLLKITPLEGEEGFVQHQSNLA